MSPELVWEHVVVEKTPSLPLRGAQLSAEDHFMGIIIPCNKRCKRAYAGRKESIEKGGTNFA